MRKLEGMRWRDICIEKERSRERRRQRERERRVSERERENERKRGEGERERERGGAVPFAILGGCGRAPARRHPMQDVPAQQRASGRRRRDGVEAGLGRTQAAVRRGRAAVEEEGIRVRPPQPR